MTDPVGEQQALLKLVVSRLNDVGILHMVAGSLASSLHGEPRMTRDIDIVVDGTANQLQAFADLFDHEVHYLTDPIEALNHRSMFTIVDIRSGWKVDLMIRKDRPFSRSELDRRIETRIGAVDVAVVSPEDSILSKLEWAKLGESGRQLDDVVGMIKANGGRLDWAYIRRWAKELAVTAELERALAAAAD